MNASIIALGGLHTLVQASVWSILLLKVTAILIIAWLVYFVLKQVNPRWRILLWRVTAAGLMLLLVATWMFPALKLRILQPPSVEETVAVVSDTTTHVEKKATVSDTTGVPQPNHSGAMRGPFGFPGERFARFPSDMPSLLENNSTTTNENSLNPSLADNKKLPEVDPTEAAGSVAEPEALAEAGSVMPLKTLKPASPTFMTWPYSLLAIWFVGVFFQGLRLLLGHLRISRLARRAQPAASWICEESLRIAEAVGCRRSVKVLQSSEVVSPFLFGARCPRLLLPKKMSQTAYRSDLPAILAHELTHVRHNDIVWNLSLQLLSIVLWFHPLAWRMRKAHLASCELVSDAASANFVGDVSDYCRILARVAVDACGALPSTGMAMARTSVIIHRLNVLRKNVFHNPLRRHSVLGFALVALLSATMLGVLQLAFAEPSEEKTPDEVAATPSDEAVSPTPFKATLPDGTTVEILGLSESPSTDKQWWKPDGTPLEKPLYDSAKFEFRVPHSESDVAREVAYRISKTKDSDIWFKTIFKQVGNEVGIMSLPNPKDSTLLQAQAVAVRKNKSSFSVGVEYALGEWTTNHTTRSHDESIGADEDGGFIIAPATEEKGSARLRVTHYMGDRQVRFVAIDLDATRHISSGQHFERIGEKLTRVTASFHGLPLSKVKEFRIESRPKKWLKLGDIALYPQSAPQTNSLKAEDPQTVAKQPESKPAEKEKTLAATQNVDPSGKSESSKKSNDIALAENTMKVHVLDEAGKPLEEAEIHVCFWTEEKDFNRNRDYKTDSQGIAEIELPKTYSIARIWTGKKSFATLFSHWEQNELANKKLPKEYTVQMEKTVNASGRIVDEEGKPITGVKVEIMSSGGTPIHADGRTGYNIWLATGSSTMPQEGDAVITDAEGRWQIQNVPGNKQLKLRMMVTHPDYISDDHWGERQDDANISTQMLLDETATLTLKRGIRVQGQVTDPDGKPIKNAIVVLGDNPYDSRVPQKFPTDDEGRFHLPAMKSQETTLSVIIGGWAPQLRHLKVEPGLAPQNFQLKPGKPIELRFVDSAGKAIPDVRVSILEWKGSESIQSSHNPNHPKVPSTQIPKNADENGVWQWTSAPDEPVKLRAYYEGYASHELEIAGGTPPRTITMKPEHRITGAVTDAVTGKPIPAFGIIPIDVFRKNWLSAERFNAKPGKNGQLDYLATRTDIPLRLQIEADGYRAQLGPEFRVGDDNSLVQNFCLQPSKPITGTVVDLNGQPAKRAEVFLGTRMQEIELDSEIGNYKILSDAEGRFTFPDPGEPIIVLAQTKSGVVTAQFPANQHDLGILKLQPWASIRGQFYDGGKPVRKASVILNPKRERNLDEPKLDGSLQTQTDNEGRFEFPRVMSGLASVRVYLGPWRDAGYRSGPSVPLSIKPSQKIEINLGKEGAIVQGKVQLAGDVPDGLNCTYSLNQLYRRESVIKPSPEIAALGFDISKGLQNNWDKTKEGLQYLGTLQSWFVKLAPDGSFRVSGVPAGKYDLKIKIYAKPEGCLTVPLVEKIVPITVTEDDVARGEVTLPEIAAKVVDVPEVGDRALLEFQQIDGNNGSLKSFLGHYTVLHFWTSWCSSCKEQLPALQKLQSTSPIADLKILSLSMDEDSNAWKAALTQLTLPWQQGRLLSTDTIGISSVPNYWLLDPTGKIVAKTYDPEKLAAVLEEIKLKQATKTPVTKPTKPQEKATANKVKSETTVASEKNTMRVHVLDEAGKPLGDASIHASFGTEEKDFNRTGDYKTDAQGVALIQVPKTYYNVCLWTNKEHFASMISDWKPNELAQGKELPEEFTIKLVPTVTVGGRILDEQGKPIAGVKVQGSVEGGTPTSTDSHTSYRWQLTGKDGSLTDDKGCWQIENFPDDAEAELKLIAYHPDYVSDRYWNNPKDSGMTMERLREGTATRTLRRGVAAQGRVIDPDGKPIKDAIVLQGEDYYGAWIPCQFVTDNEGQFRLPALAPQKTTVAVLASGWSPMLHYVDVEEGMAAQEFKMTQGKPIELRFVDADGHPVPDVKVSITGWNDRRFPLWGLKNNSSSELPDMKIPSQADADGLWLWNFAPDGKVNLTASKQGFAPCELEIAGGASAKTVTMKPSHRITGQVTDAVTNKPVSAFTVIPINVFGKNSVSADWSEVRKGKEGQLDYHATRTDIPLRLRIQAPSYRTQTGPEFRVGDDTSRTQDFRLQPSKPITGVILDSKGQPMPKVEVKLATPTDLVEVPPVWNSNKTLTDADGRFSFPDPGEAFAILVDTDAGFVLENFPADHHDVGALQLQPWAMVSGTFVDEGKPVRNAIISLNSRFADSPDLPAVHNSPQVRTDDNGHFEFPHVLPIPVYVQVMKTERDAKFGSGPSMPLKPKSGQHIELDFGGTGASLKGKVMLKGKLSEDLDYRNSRVYLISRTSGVEPLPAAIAKMGFDMKNGWQTKWLESDAGWGYLRTFLHWDVTLTPDGSFCISGVPAGEYDLAIEIFSKFQCYTRKDLLAEKVVPVTVTDQNVASGEMKLPEITLEALVSSLKATTTKVKPEDQKRLQEKSEETKPATVTPEKNTMKVHVLDEEGKPLEGVEVHANIWPKVEGFDTNRKYYTDPQGEVVVNVPKTLNMLRLFVTKKSYVPIFKGWEENWLKVGNQVPKEHTFTMQKGTVIGGVVKDEEGKPIKGVKVEVSYTMEPGFRSHLAYGEDAPATDAEGRWTLDNVPQDITTSLSLRFKHPDYESDATGGHLQIKQGISLEALRTQKATLVMKRGFPITGTVTGPDGKPVTNALVAQGADRYGTEFPTTRTDKDGHYRFSNMAPNSYPDGAILTVIAPGFAPTLRKLEIEPDMKPVDFQLEKGNTLRVRVVDKENQPLQGVFMSTDTWRQNRTLCDLEINKLTDAEGRWTWTWAPKDAIQMRIFKEGYMTARLIPLAAQEEEHVITLYPALKISGKVIDAETKEPISNFRVVHGRSLPRNVDDEIYWDPWKKTFGKEGKYEITIGEPERVHAIRIEADGYLPTVSRKFKDDEGSVTCDLALTKGKAINVSLLLPDGKPAAGAEARLTYSTPNGTVMFINDGQFSPTDSNKTKLQVNEDGHLTIEPQGCEYLLVVIHDQGFANVTSEELAANSQVKLTAWARLEGTVRRNSKPIANEPLSVDALETLGSKHIFINFRSRTTTDANGNFAFAKLKPGKWQLNELSESKKSIPNSQQRRDVVNLMAGETLKISIDAQELVGQIEWPEGKLPDGNLTRISASISFKLPERPNAPEEVRKQGPDAVRYWLKKWNESEAGKAYHANLPSCWSQTVLIDEDGKLHGKDVVPGEYDLKIFIPSNGKRLPWESPKLLRYKAVLSVPKISNNEHGEPLDLGKVSLIDESPKEISLASLQQPEKQNPGEKSVGTFKDQAELLRYVIYTYKENKAKIQTWQGKAIIESRTSDKTQPSEDELTSRVEFTFDRKQESVRWKHTLEKWKKSIYGKEEPKTVPQIINGMVTPDGFYQFGHQGTEPGDPLKHSLILDINPPERSQRIRQESHTYTFLPFLYLDTPRGDVARELVTYLGWSDIPSLDCIRVIREGDHVTIDFGTDEQHYNRYTLSLSQGCNPISYESNSAPDSSWKYLWTYEQVDGVWLPKTWTETVHQKNSQDKQSTITFVENRVNQSLDSSAFSLHGLGLKPGDNIQDRRKKPTLKYKYQGE